MKRPKIDHLIFEEASDLSRAICDEPRVWDDEPSVFSRLWQVTVKAYKGIIRAIASNWKHAHDRKAS